MPKNNNNLIMEHPFPKSMSLTDRCKRLQEVADYDDTLGIIINADPDAMASAMALKRFFWRKVKKTSIYHINVIKRADNLAMIKLLNINLKHIRKLNNANITKWAIVDSQPHHNEQFGKYEFDIIIDHHPASHESKGSYVDIKEDYGATSTMLVEYLRAAGIKPSPTLATALFYGIKTDTDNFVGVSTPHDINAFKYLYQFVNVNIIKKIESSEVTRNTLGNYRRAMERLMFIKDMAFVNMGRVDNPDTLVIIADFFLKMAEATWSIVSGLHGKKMIIILRNAGFRLDAGKTAEKLFGPYGMAGGHKSAARAEIQLDRINRELENNGEEACAQFILDKLKGM
jgi:nanoRNase/pAp phosphatase (c-di-AMP/oligoRNAs hydrolase)